MLILFLVGCAAASKNGQITHAELNKKTAKKYFKLGQKFFDEEDYSEAKHYLERSNSIQKSIFQSEYNRLTGGTNYYLGLTYFQLGKYDKSLSLSLKALDIQTHLLGSNHKRVSAIQNSIGKTYFKLGEYQKAKEHLNIARNLGQLNFGEVHKSIATAFNYLGRVNLVLGDYEQALHDLNQSKSLHIEIFGNEHKSVVTDYNLLGLTYFQKGDFKSSLEFYDKALNISQKVNGQNHNMTANTYFNIARVYTQIGLYDQALQHIQTTLNIQQDIFSNIHSNMGDSYYLMGRNFYNQKRYLQAIEKLEKARNIFNETLGEKHNKVARVYDFLGRVYFQQKNFQSALEYLNKSLEIQKKLFRLEHKYNASTYKQIGLVYIDLKDYEASSKHLNTALKIEENILSKEHNSLILTYRALSKLHVQQNNEKESYLYSKKAFNIFIVNRDRNFTILDNQQKLAYVKSNKELITELFNSAFLYIIKLNSLNRNDLAEKIKRDTINDWLRYKGAIFDNENALSILYDKIKDPQLHRKIDQLNALKQQLSKLYQTIPKPDERELFKEKIKTTKMQISNIEINLSQNINEYKEELGLRAITYEQISSQMSENELYIDFAKTEHNYFVFGLDHQKSISFTKVSRQNTAMIDEYIKTFREQIEYVSKKQTNSPFLSDQQTKNTLSSLYDTITDSLHELTSQTQNRSTLIFSLDGVLNFLPFEALYDKASNRYLIEEKKIRYVPSGKEFVRLTKKSNYTTKNSNITLFTNPDFGFDLSKEEIKRSNNRSASYLHKSLFSMYFTDLPGTKDEAMIIQKLYKNTTNYDQTKATPNNLYQINSPKILHISTHGFFIKDKNIQNPMLKSGLAFSGANMARIKGDGSGIVTGLKLAGLNLKETELVVLSACETGLGDIHQAEGVAGLNKAFIKAGAKNIVMSLWSVNDRQTTQLMEYFYRSMKNLNYQDALREAKLQMIEQKLHPFYWSAFVLNGI